MPRFFLLITLMVFLVSCDHLPSVDQDPIVARVGSHYLYASELSAQLMPQLSEEDSTLLRKTSSTPGQKINYSTIKPF